MIVFAPIPIPVVVVDGHLNQEAYLIYVESSGAFENDIWTIVLCDSGKVLHVNTSQVRIHQNATLGISK